MQISSLNRARCIAQGSTPVRRPSLVILLGRIEERVHEIDGVVRVLGGDVACSLHVLLLSWLSRFWRGMSSSISYRTKYGIRGET